MLGIDKMIHAELEHKNCAVEFYVNGIPVKKYDSGDQLFISVPSHRYLVDGINKLEMIVNPGSTPSHARQGSEEHETTGVFAKAKLVRYPVGVFTGDKKAEVIVEVEYRGKTDNKEVFPRLLSVSKDLGQLVGHWSWQDAEVVTLNKKDINAIMDYVKIIHDAYAKGNGALIMQKAKIRMEEGHRANPGKDINFSRESFIRDLKRDSELSGWKIEPLSSLIPDLRVVADGKMVETIARDWKPLVRTKPIPEYNNDVFDYRMFLSKINGEWQMVR